MAGPYFFDDFTEGHYRHLLRLASSRYRFAPFDDFQSPEPIVLWRHDVDISMHRALRLAEIEAEESATATYFVLFHSEFYNLLEKPIVARLRKIRDFGHRIGLHFDASFYDDIVDINSLEARLRWERAMLEDLTGEAVTSFAFHNPEVGDVLRFDHDIIASMVNAYGRTIRSSFGYCSDSNGYWRFRRIKDVLEQSSEERLQVLTHPAWWQEEPMSPRDRVRRCIDGRARRQLELYEWTLEAQGRKNVS